MSKKAFAKLVEKNINFKDFFILYIYVILHNIFLFLIKKMQEAQKMNFTLANKNEMRNNIKVMCIYVVSYGSFIA